MKQTLVIVLGITLAGAAAQAQLSGLPESAEAARLRIDRYPVLQAVGLREGGGGGARGTWDYDTFSCLDCYQGMNLSWVDPACYVNGGADCPGEVWVLPMNRTPVEVDGVVYQAPTYDDGQGQAWFTDAFVDDYEFTWTGPYLESLRTFSGHCLTIGPADGQAKTIVFRYLWFSADGTEFYGGWTWEVEVLPDVSQLYTLTAGTIDEPLHWSETFEVPTRGLLLFDYDDESIGGCDDAGALNVLLGGDLQSPVLPYPTDLYGAGFNDEMQWLAMGFDDPDADEGYDGEVGLSYLDIINTGTLINWAFASGIGELAHGHPTQMNYIWDEPCYSDLDGDDDVDQSDLGILLAAFGISAAGDLDGDGDTDQVDLGILLADYGCGV